MGTQQERFTWSSGSSSRSISAAERPDFSNPSSRTVRSDSNAVGAIAAAASYPIAGTRPPQIKEMAA